MDKSKILRLCNEIEKEISEAWNCDVIEYDKAGHIISIAQTIADEIIAPPKSNGDRIRQMTDEELANKMTDKCAVCAYHNAECETTFCLCVEGVLKWLKQDATDTNVGGKGGEQE